MGNKTLRRIGFIKEFMKHLKNKKTVLFVIDEMGIGSNPLRHYGYSKVGTPAVLHTRNLISKNLTCTATISRNGIEFLQFFFGGGTTNETFQSYFGNLMDAMLKKYPEKKLVFVLDNLWAHKCSLIVDIVKQC